MDNQLSVNSEQGVQLRRDWVAEQYVAGVPTQLIWKEYGKKYNLTKHSLDKDITHIREALTMNVQEDYQDIMNTNMLFLYDLRAKCLKDEDRGGALRVNKQVIDILKLVVPKQSKTLNVHLNDNSTNLSVPNLSVDEIRDLLRGNEHGNVIEIPSE